MISAQLQREHLEAAPLQRELGLLDLLLERHVLRLRAAQLLNETDFRGLYIADEEVDATLRSAGRARPDGDTTIALSARIEEARGEWSVCGLAPPLQLLQRALALDRFDIELLIVAAAAEIDLRYQTLFAYAQNDVTRKLPSIDLILQLLCDDARERVFRRDAFAHDAPLIRERIVRVADEQPEREGSWLARAVRADERIASFLLGRNALDVRIAPCARRGAPARTLNALRLDDALHDRIAAMLPRLGHGAATVVIEGRAGAGRTAIVEAIAGELGLRLITLDVAQLPSSLAFTEAVSLLRREAILAGDAVVIDHFDRIAGDENAVEMQRTRAALQLLSLGRPVFIITSESWSPEAAFRPSPVYELALGVASQGIRERLWSDALGPDADAIDLTSIAAFELTPAQIGAAAAHGRTRAACRSGGRELTQDDLSAGAREQSSRSLHRFASPVELKQSWDDLVLPSRPTQQLRDVCTALRHRSVVYDRWGLGRRFAGRGLAILLSGPSGTGKSLAASIIAREIGREMFKIDLSAVVSKYIGETEKNLSRLFDEAQRTNAILFFDEADALFGKRSEVKDAHDRYANIETAYLLQRIELFSGICCIMATNLARNLDDALARRLFDTIEFPFPDAAHRSRIWLTIAGDGLPVESDVDYDFLGRQFELSGGNIRNVVVSAAFTAAAAERPVCMRDLVIATARELLKIGRLPSRNEFLHYYDIVRESV